MVGPVADGVAAGNAVLTSGKDAGGLTRTVSVDFAGNQSTTFATSHLGPFGDLITEDKAPSLSRHWTILNAFDPQQDQTVASLNGATVSVSSGRLALVTGTTNAADACYRSIKVAQYRPGQGFVFRYTAAFASGVASSAQEVGFGNGSNGGGGNAVAFGFNGTAFGILHRNAGSSTWVAQTSWNGDRCDGSASASTNPSGFNLTTARTNLNVYAIHVPFLGAGDIRYFVLDPTTGNWILCHTVRYAGTSTALEFSDPAFRFYGRAVSTGSTTNLTVLSGSAAAFVVGKVGNDGQQWAESRTLSVNGTAAVFSIKCATTVNGALNNTPIRVRSIAFSADNGNTTSVGIASIGVTLGGTPAFGNLTGFTGTVSANGDTIGAASPSNDAQTIGTIDTAGTTITGGRPIYNTTTARNNVASSGELEENPLYVYPGQTITFYAVTGASANVTFAVNGTVG
jgi:hypothetical protein